MIERNLCKEADCSASCCHDMRLSGNIPEEQIKNYFPDATKIPSTDLFERIPDGVYYAETGTQFYSIRLVGPCPNLLENSDCGIYEDRPVACKRMMIGGDYCSNARIKDGLLPIEVVIQKY